MSDLVGTRNQTKIWGAVFHDLLVHSNDSALPFIDFHVHV